MIKAFAEVSFVSQDFRRQVKKYDSYDKNFIRVKIIYVLNFHGTDTLALDCISFGLKRTRVRHKRVIAKYYPLIEVLDGIPQAHCIAKKCHGRLNIIVWLTWLF